MKSRVLRRSRGSMFLRMLVRAAVLRRGRAIAALLALIVAPLAWLILLPFRLFFLCVEALFALARALLFLPARLLGHRGRP